MKLSAKNLFNKINDNRVNLLVVDWHKDDQPRARVKSEVETSLDDEVSFNAQINLLMNHFVDMAVQGYGWVVGN